MRLIGHIDNAEQARTFGDYLYVQGIHNEMDREDNGAYAVWIADEDAVEKAKTLLERFRNDPVNPEYKRVARGADEQRKAVQKDDEAARKRIVKAKQLYPEMRAYGVGVFTFLLIAGCVWVSIISKMGKETEPIAKLFMSEYGRGVFLPEVRAGEVWRLFSPMLIHFGPVHIICNMMWLFQLGSLIESRQGTGFFLAMVLIIAGGSNLTQYMVGGAGFGGMSGVVFGLFGYVWMQSKFNRGAGYFIDQQSVIIMMIWLFACIFLIQRIANGAHVGGLVIGVVWGLIAAFGGKSGRV